MKLFISQEEIRQRQKSFIQKLEEEGIEAAILFDYVDIFYLTGFQFRPSERPIAFILDQHGDGHLFVPQLEKEHAEEYAVVKKVYDYPEYPGKVHPMNYLADILKTLFFETLVVGYDALSYSSTKGYKGPAISDLLAMPFAKSIKGYVEQLRYIKSPGEIELIKESVRWGNLAHTLLVKYTEVGKREIEVEGRASLEATQCMFDTLGPHYKPFGSPAVHTFYRGQIGPHSAFPHSQNQNATFERGYNVVSQSASFVWGYTSELERTMFIQDINKEQETYFHIMLGAQEVAFRTIRPGIPASKVEEEVQRYFKEKGVTELTRHHTGHNIGMLNHEAPFFDLGDHTILQPGMVFSVEPGLYVKGLGAFRHSDTILITKDGMELLTYYPRDLQSLIIG
ncbi:Xaa-Pro peptidase family protein [Siminovitchia sp. FSL H7-0308]|uniref:M24 family metallopeptidase n=1 Tax=Siminovitchia sp. FSL H7-0308 TaxID=2921432 RepID=UPI0030EC729F